MFYLFNIIFNKTIAQEKLQQYNQKGPIAEHVDNSGSTLYTASQPSLSYETGEMSASGKDRPLMQEALHWRPSSRGSSGSIPVPEQKGWIRCPILTLSTVVTHSLGQGCSGRRLPGLGQGCSGRRWWGRSPDWEVLLCHLGCCYQFLSVSR